jgi:hypothetical protein
LINILAREVLGRRQVQGVDYAYTLNGWVKAVNSSISGATHTSASVDMGHDADVNGLNASVAKDAYGFSLDYFAGDYRPIGSVQNPAIETPVVNMLYNGNIAGATYSSAALKPKTVGYTYDYDQLNPPYPLSCT